MTTATGLNFDDDSVRRLRHFAQSRCKVPVKKNKKRSSERKGWESGITNVPSSQEVSRFGTRFGPERGTCAYRVGFFVFSVRLYCTLRNTIRSMREDICPTYFQFS